MKPENIIMLIDKNLPQGVLRMADNWERNHCGENPISNAKFLHFWKRWKVLAVIFGALIGILQFPILPYLKPSTSSTVSSIGLVIFLTSIFLPSLLLHKLIMARKNIREFCEDLSTLERFAGALQRSEAWDIDTLRKVAHHMLHEGHHKEEHIREHQKILFRLGLAALS